MNTDGKYQDPYTRKEFWVVQLNAKSRAELEQHMIDFDPFINEMADEYRIVMTASRRDVCHLALEEIILLKNQYEKNSRQGELFD